MDKVIEKALKLREELIKEPVIAEYLRVKCLVEESEELSKMRHDIALYKKNNDKEEYDRLKQMYDNHPLVSNYYNLKEESFELLKEISKIIL